MFFRHVYTDIEDKETLVRHLQSMQWWLRRAPVLDISLRCFEPVIGAHLAALLGETCAQRMITARPLDDAGAEAAHDAQGDVMSYTPTRVRDSPLLRRLASDDLSGVCWTTRETMWCPFRQSLKVLNVTGASLDALACCHWRFASLVALSLSQCALPPLDQLVAWLPSLDALALESCRGVNENLEEDRSSAIVGLVRNGVFLERPAPPHRVRTGQKRIGAREDWEAVEGRLVESLAILAASLTLLSLRDVSLDYMPQLTWIDRLHNLRRLDLSFCRQAFTLNSLLIKEDALTGCAAAALPHLMSLRIRHTFVGDIAPLRYAPRLCTLDLEGCDNIASARVFQDYPCGLHPRELDLSNTAIKSVEPLSRLYCPSLEVVNLAYCIRVAAFDVSSDVHRLRDLDRTGTRVTNLRWAVRCPGLASLCLHNCKELVDGALTPVSVTAAVNEPVLPCLRELGISGSGVTSLTGWSACFMSRPR